MRTMMMTMGAIAAILSATTGAAPATAQAVPAQLDAALNRNNTNYAQLRTAILAEGWRPVINPACQRNVYGGSVEAPIQPSGTNVCRVLTEIESCSGDGYCNMYFSKRGETTFLRVMTYGDYDAPQGMTVNGWEMSRSNGIED